MLFKKAILYEISKLLIFLSFITFLIYLIQTYNEHQANQYILIDTNSRQSNICPLYPANLKGFYDVNIDSIPKFSDLEKEIGSLNNGGVYRPAGGCKERQKLAIIIPYRDREDNLVLLLKYLHPLLQRQNRYYQIFLVEQYGNDIFNKGRIMNIGVSEAMKIDNFDCFIFHDVDLIPENDHNIYECDTNPRHLSPAVDELRYTLMYYNLVGGVLALNTAQVEKTNGFSNLYWGWGAEDDDMSMRILHSGYKIARPPNYVGRYKMILHRKRSRAINRFKLLDYWTRYTVDGVNSLNKLNYSIHKITYSYLYTNITIDIGPSKVETVDEIEVKKENFKFH